VLVSDLTAFLQARLHEELNDWGCPDVGEYADCDTRSNRLVWYAEAAGYIVASHKPEPWTGRLDDGLECQCCAGGWPCRTVKSLAQVYQAHPDFDPRWRL
jgi:hypothetical protein